MRVVCLETINKNESEQVQHRLGTMGTGWQFQIGSAWQPGEVTAGGFVNRFHFRLF